MKPRHRIAAFIRLIAFPFAAIAAWLGAKAHDFQCKEIKPRMFTCNYCAKPVTEFFNRELMDFRFGHTHRCVRVCKKCYEEVPF